jgi:methyltransferase-like protein 23
MPITTTQQHVEAGGAGSCWALRLVAVAQDVADMTAPNKQPSMVHSQNGEFPLHEYRLRQAGREWTVLHTGAILTQADEAHFLRELKTSLPYGVALWPAAIALAHELASRADSFHGKRVLELGAGTGLPGIIAASLGAQVTQTDYHADALSLCRHNGARNQVESIEYRLADWTAWSDTERYDWILGSDILYGEALQAPLRRIFETNLAVGGRVLLADPFRRVSLQLLEGMEADGWMISLSKWMIGAEIAARPMGVFELSPP